MELFSRYLTANFLILAVWGVLWILDGAQSGLRLRLRATHFLKLAYFLLFSVFAIVFFAPKSSSRWAFHPAAQVWSAHSIKESFGANDAKGNRTDYVSLAPFKKSYSFNIDFCRPTLCLFYLLGVAFLLFRTVRAFGQTRSLVRSSTLLRKWGNVEVRVYDFIAVPFSFWTGRRALVVMPSSMISDPRSFGLAIRHEIQHHRQRDTVLVYGLQLIKIFFFWNPFCHWLIQRIHQYQEIACDEVLVDQRKLSLPAYCRCLVSAAETALASPHKFVGTTNLLGRGAGPFLKRRITLMLSKKKKYASWSVGVSCGLFTLFLLVSTAMAAQGVIQDRRITLDEAQKLAAPKDEADTFPLTLNESVVAELNRYLGTPDGRNFIRGALERMELYRGVVEAKLAKYNLPKELVAIPITESGYQNLAARNAPAYSAGLWQFTPGTAHNYGLKVIDPREGYASDDVEQRTDVELSTDAALRYLGALNLRFQNWELAVLAYNAGENRVQDGIDATNKRNAWTLIDQGYGGDDRYLSKVTAAILIMKNPELVN